MFLLRDLEQNINPFVLLSYNESAIQEKEETFTNKLDSNTLEYEGVVRRSKSMHLIRAENGIKDFLVNFEKLIKIFTKSY